MKTTVGMLTYKTHLNKDEYRAWLQTQFPKHNDMKIAVAHESGDEDCPYEHTHALIHFGKSTAISNKRVQSGFNYNDIHPNWKSMVGRTAWRDGLKYITKEDIDVGYELEDEVGFEGVIDRIWDCNNEQEVLKLCTKPTDIIPYLHAYKFRLQADEHIEYQEQFRNAELNEYQLEWWKRLQAQDDRRILWICNDDPKGGIGKNWFGKWLRVNYGAERMLLNNKAVHFMWKGSEYVYVNITRTYEDYVSYGTLEDLKDGEMISPKYEGRSVMYRPAKVIVFANFYPNVKAMSEDRWEILRYGSTMPSPGGLAELRLEDIKSE